ncbi:52 kDa repressor of the inhibitor of the protein kinase-like [Diorhabda sublineata]|uniref:52 kDa repressor of the inhibitor of the protein kinase-like n=1 Tax=Diorhabda sublineata TaxID=1163346 RepID=UPI0024E10285|nr:52 kDa repressor of the inhibitor of the protein kinase-like [Diorhabda sublineata]
MGIADDPECRWCMEKDETADHVISWTILERKDNDKDRYGEPRTSQANIGQASHPPAEPVNISVADYSSPSTSQQTYDVKVHPDIIDHENDLDRYVGLATQLSTENKRELLQNPWIPPKITILKYIPSDKLKSRLEKCQRNVVYTSPKIRNELINLCGEVIEENIISEVQKTVAYAVLVHETADVAGKEQLLIGVRFYDESKRKIREQFAGFVEVKVQNASAIAEAIDNFLISSNFPTEDCVGFGFDGCSTIAGKEGGIQAILRKKYPRALYFNCSSHKLNLVVSDANAVPEISNTVAIVKDVITFFRVSSTHRNYAPNLSRLCKTRWSENINQSETFPELVKSLEKLSVEGNYATRKSAYQLHSAVTKPVFIVALQTIAKYLAVLEPVVNALQAKSIDMISLGAHRNFGSTSCSQANT